MGTPIRLVSVVPSEDGEGERIFLALDDEGRLWRGHYSWLELCWHVLKRPTTDDLPQIEEEKSDE